MADNIKAGMIRLTNDTFIMAHHVTRVVADQWDDNTNNGTVYVYTNEDGCASIEREDDKYLPVLDMVEVIARAVMTVVRSGDDMDLRSRLLTPRY